jgi:hypothetical protein
MTSAEVKAFDSIGVVCLRMRRPGMQEEHVLNDEDKWPSILPRELGFPPWPTDRSREWRLAVVATGQGGYPLTVGVT